MRAWLFVLAVLATFTLVTQQVASTEEVMSHTSLTDQTMQQTHLTFTPSPPSSLSSSASSSSSLASSLSSLTLELEQPTIVDVVDDEEEEMEVETNNNYKNLDNLNTNSDHKREKPDPQTLVQIEKNLLSLFGFKKQPNIDRSKVIIPEAMKKLYAEIMGHELDSLSVPKPGLHTKNANTVRSFTHEESEIDNRFNHHQHRFRLHFNVSSIPVEEKLRAAELTLSRQAIDNELYEVRHKVLIYDIIRPGIKGRREPIFLLIDTKTLNINGSNSVSLDVLPAVERWLKTPKHNHGLLVQVTALTLPVTAAATTKSPSSSLSSSSSSSKVNKNNFKFSIKSNKHNNFNNVPVHNHIRLRRSIDESKETWTNKQPLLFTYTDDGKYKQRSIRDARPRRTLMRNGGRRRKDGRESCQRRPLYVDFSDVGWNSWIVAPPGYEAYYCSGDCVFPIVDHLNTTNHAIVQTLVNSINPSLAPKACCVPTQLSSICMLYLDSQNKVVLKNYQDMSVVGCGCR